MKKLIFYSIAAFVSLTILTIVGCHKQGTTITTQDKVEETNVHIVPENNARSVAVTFNPNRYFYAADLSNHSPSKSTLNGNNSIKSEITINDNYGKPAIYIYNFDNDAGSLFVSADSNMHKVLAFIEHGEYGKAVVPAGLVAWQTGRLKISR